MVPLGLIAFLSPRSMRGFLLYNKHSPRHPARAVLPVSMGESKYAHSTMETKVEAMNCIEKYL